MKSSISRFPLTIFILALRQGVRLFGPHREWQSYHRLRMS